MTLRTSQLCDLWGMPEGGTATPDQPIGPICTDTRTLVPGSLFVPLIGERFDAHRFLPEVQGLGATAAVVARDAASEIPPGLLHWRVEDTLLAYQQLACLHRRQLSGSVVAVTGSAGKTTTRELIRGALASLGLIHASAANNNNDIGVPLTLLQTQPETRAVILELGMRGPGEIERLSRCAEPDLAVITNIGTAHIGRLGSREAIAAAKCEITAALQPDGAVIIPAGDPLLEQALRAVWSGRVIRVRLDDDPVAEADLVGSIRQDSLIWEGHSIPLPLEGRHNARNLLLACAVASELGVSTTALQTLNVSVPGGRNRRLQQGSLTVLDETYNASPEAVIAALDLLASMQGRRFAVLGSMLELGERSAELHRQVAAHAARCGVDGLVVVAEGDDAQAMAEAAGDLERLEVVNTPEQAAEPLTQWLQPGDTVLLKASRGVAMERLLPLLPAL